MEDNRKNCPLDKSYPAQLLPKDTVPLSMAKVSLNISITTVGKNASIQTHFLLTAHDEAFQKL
jgi:hypothetical protein